jgi:hypothetical protein
MVTVKQIFTKTKDDIKRNNKLSPLMCEMKQVSIECPQKRTMKIGTREKQRNKKNAILFQ